MATSGNESLRPGRLRRRWRAARRGRERLLEGCCWGVVALAFVGDIVLTAQGLARGFGEANPVAAWLLGVVGFPGLVLLKTGALGVGVAGWRVLPESHRYVAPVCLAVPWVLATVSNFWLLHVA